MELESFDMEKGEGKRIPAAGRCIYCGDDNSELTDEHVIPYALGGNTVIFEKACCIPCQRLIQPYEQRVLRGQLGVYRTRIDAPTRRRRDRPTHKQLQFIEVDDRGQFVRNLSTRELPVEDTPLAFSVWDLAPPRILGEGNPEAQHAGRPWTYVQRELAMKLVAEVREETKAKHVAVKVDEINRADFLRFLAKTAHAFAVSEQGLDAFKPLTADLILGKSEDLAEFVGGDAGPSPNEDDPANMVELAIGKIKDGPASGYTGVRIRLYPLLGTPAHVVVVGAPN